MAHTETEPQVSEKRESAIDWSSLLNAAEDPEIAEFLRPPVDNAVSILKSGREIQKLTVIRTLSDLLDTDGEQTVAKVFPLIQELLENDTSNLDVHCEAAVAYKNIYGNIKLTSRIPALSDVILDGILRNASQQKNNLTAAAWLETLVDVVDQAPASSIKQLVVPLALSQAEPTQRAQRRVLSTKLIAKLATVLPALLVRKNIAPCAQKLSKDPNSNVRSSIAGRIGTIAESLRNPSDCGTMIMPCLAELCNDGDAGVREAALNTIAECIPLFSKECRKNQVISLLKKCTEQAIAVQDETLSVVAKNLGEWMHALKDVLSTSDSSWFLDIYIRITSLSRGITKSSTRDDVDRPSPIQVAARRMCAYNFPCIVLTYGEKYFKDRLLPILEGFCIDPDEDVRSAIAAGFNEVVKLVPNEPALIPPFIELIRGSSGDVVGHITNSLDRILPNLYHCVGKQSNLRLNRVHLDRIIIGCNRLIRNTSSWRAHHSYLQNIAILRRLVPVKDLFISFVPMLKQEVLTARAIPCRVAASLTLLLFMRENPDKAARQTIIDFFVHSVAKHQSCHRRRLFLDIIPDVIATFSRKFYHENFLNPALEMARDRTLNIRLQLCHTLTKIKSNLILPEDEPILRKLEGIVRDMLANEQNTPTRQLIQTYACELSRGETRPKGDKDDQYKEKTEKELWSRKVEKAELHNGKTTRMMNTEVDIDEVTEVTTNNQNDNEKLDVGPWRTRRTVHPRTAIVRPQPHVVVTQRSPSPMPRLGDERKSRLPMASPLASSNTVQPSRSSSRPTLPVPPQRSTKVSVKARHTAGRYSVSNSPADSSNPTPTSNVSHRRSSIGTVMSRSTPSPRQTTTGTTTLTPSLSSSTIRPLGQSGLIKVRSFSNIAKTPSHISAAQKMDSDDNTEQTPPPSADISSSTHSDNERESELAKLSELSLESEDASGTQGQSVSERAGAMVGMAASASGTGAQIRQSQFGDVSARLERKRKLPDPESTESNVSEEERDVERMGSRSPRRHSVASERPFSSERYSGMELEESLEREGIDFDTRLREMRRELEMGAPTTPKRRRDLCEMHIEEGDTLSAQMNDATDYVPLKSDRKRRTAGYDESSESSWKKSRTSESGNVVAERQVTMRGQMREADEDTGLIDLKLLRERGGYICKGQCDCSKSKERIRIPEMRESTDEHTAGASSQSEIIRRKLPSLKSLGEPTWQDCATRMPKKSDTDTSPESESPGKKVVKPCLRACEKYPSHEEGLTVKGEQESTQMGEGESARASEEGGIIDASLQVEKESTSEARRLDPDKNNSDSDSHDDNDADDEMEVPRGGDDDEDASKSGQKEEKAVEAERADYRAETSSCQTGRSDTQADVSADQANTPAERGDAGQIGASVGTSASFGGAAASSLQSVAAASIGSGGFDDDGAVVNIGPVDNTSADVAYLVQRNAKRRHSDKDSHITSGTPTHHRHRGEGKSPKARRVKSPAKLFTIQELLRKEAVPTKSHVTRPPFEMESSEVQQGINVIEQAIPHITLSPASSGDSPQTQASSPFSPPIVKSVATPPSLPTIQEQVPEASVQSEVPAAVEPSKESSDKSIEQKLSKILGTPTRLGESHHHPSISPFFNLPSVTKVVTPPSLPTIQEQVSQASVPPEAPGHARLPEESSGTSIRLQRSGEISGTPTGPGGSRHRLPPISCFFEPLVTKVVTPPSVPTIRRQVSQASVPFEASAYARPSEGSIDRSIRSQGSGEIIGTPVRPGGTHHHLPPISSFSPFPPIVTKVVTPPSLPTIQEQISEATTSSEASSGMICSGLARESGGTSTGPQGFGASVRPGRTHPLPSTSPFGSPIATRVSTPPSLPPIQEQTAEATISSEASAVVEPTATGSNIGVREQVSSGTFGIQAARRTTAGTSHVDRKDGQVPAADTNPIQSPSSGNDSNLEPEDPEDPRNIAQVLTWYCETSEASDYSELEEERSNTGIKQKESSVTPRIMIAEETTTGFSEADEEFEGIATSVKYTETIPFQSPSSSPLSTTSSSSSSLSLHTDEIIRPRFMSFSRMPSGESFKRSEKYLKRGASSEDMFKKTVQCSKVELIKNIEQQSPLSVIDSNTKRLDDRFRSICTPTVIINADGYYFNVVGAKATEDEKEYLKTRTLGDEIICDDGQQPGPSGLQPTDISFTDKMKNLLMDHRTLLSGPLKLMYQRTIDYMNDLYKNLRSLRHSFISRIRAIENAHQECFVADDLQHMSAVNNSEKENRPVAGSHFLNDEKGGLHTKKEKPTMLTAFYREVSANQQESDQEQRLKVNGKGENQKPQADTTQNIQPVKKNWKSKINVRKTTNILASKTAQCTVDTA